MKGRRKRLIPLVAGLTTCAVLVSAAFLLPSRSSHGARRIQEPTPKSAIAGPDSIHLSEIAPQLTDAPVDAKNDFRPVIAARQPLVGPDPEKDADDFITGTRMEVADRVAALDKEANDLRIRLAKVEAASAKLKAAFKAIGQRVVAPGDPSNPDEAPRDPLPAEPDAPGPGKIPGELDGPPTQPTPRS